MTKYIFDTDEIEFRFSSKQIKHYMRENHYPSFVARGKMTKAKADEELSTMKEVEKTIILAQRKNLDKPWNQD